MSIEDPMLALLEWLCGQMMEIEISAQIGADKNEQSEKRSSYRSGYRLRRLDTQMVTPSTLWFPWSATSPFSITEHERSKETPIDVIQQIYAQGVYTRQMEKFAQNLGIKKVFHIQVSNINKGLNEQAEEFRNKSLVGRIYPVIWVDAMYEKVR